MDKFDLQIAMLKPTDTSAELKERLFMKKLVKARRTQQIRRGLLGALITGMLVVLVGALRRDLFDLVVLTFRYLTDFPSLLSEYTNAYVASISWPSLAAIALFAGVGGVLFRTRRDLLGKSSSQIYKYAGVMGVFALGLAMIGLLSNPSHAAAQQEALKRGLNARGHMEVRVNGDAYELYAQSGASDDSIRKQAFIEQLRNFDISKAYPDLKGMSRDGFVAEVRTVNSKDDCVFYVERRLEPALGGVVDANSGCIRHADLPKRYLNDRMQPIKEPKWKTGQTMYITYAVETTQSSSASLGAGNVGIIFLLTGKADDYVAQRLGEKVVPKGQPSTGVTSCGVDLKETCPSLPYVDVFTNAEGRMASGEIGASVPGDSLRPQVNGRPTELFGKITSVDDKSLQLQTISGKKVVISWPRNIIQEFNSNGGRNYATASGPLTIVPGDSLFVRVHYKDGMNLEKLVISDVSYIALALKPMGADPLKNEPYVKDKSALTEKY